MKVRELITELSALAACGCSDMDVFVAIVGRNGVYTRVVVAAERGDWERDHINLTTVSHGQANRMEEHDDEDQPRG